MIKKISAAALTALLALPVGALASPHRVQDLEKQMAEMSRMFNQKMAAMQQEIAALKQKQAVPVSTTAAPAAPADWTKKVKLNGMVRLRGYDLQNFWNFDNSKDNDHWNVFRLKGSLKATIQATKDVTTVIQLTDQTYGEGVGVDTHNGYEGDNRDNKVFLDNAYINVRNMFNLPVDMTFGRQNLIYGSGFVILDGQSQFASTSIYFDGVKLRWHATDKTFLDLLYMKDQEGNRDNASNDDITLSGAYLTSTGCPYIGKSEFYILNRDDEGLGKNIWMYGLRLSDKLSNGFDYSIEAAIQRGDANDTQDQKAWGTKLDAGYTFQKLGMRPRIYLGYDYLSGDKDPQNTTTGDNEGWDVFYGGWPQFGDLLAWKYVQIPSGNALENVYDYNRQSSTTGEAVYSNLQIMTLGTSAHLLKDLAANISYSKLKFNHTYAGVSDDFGDYYQGKLKYQYNKNLSFSMYGALIAPGDAFNDTPKNNATEAYWETEYKF
ncbi:MAG TPA: hypothetical protein ENK33_12720 [Desulfobacterales bacterium]|nr:hypothetical protein [Desulfobacterales bacterium]